MSTESRILAQKPLRRSEQLQGPERQRVRQLREEFDRRLAALGEPIDQGDPAGVSAAVDVILEMLVRRKAI